MSLARTLMNGGMIGEVAVESARYGHADGATIIAMESVEELHDIFLESYNYEQADIAAMTEGVALEGSQYEAVAEAAIKNALTKVKEFFQKLWAKIKAFFANVRRYLDAIFMSGKDFVKKYQKQIDKISVKDFTYNMYTYNDSKINGFVDETKGEVDKEQEIMDEVKKTIDDEINGMNGDSGEANPELDKIIEDLKKRTEDDAFVKDAFGINSADDFDEYAFKLYRKDTERDEVSLSSSDIQEFAKQLADNSKCISSFTKVQSMSDKLYSNAIKVYTDAEKKYDKLKGAKSTQLSRLASANASYFSKAQAYSNRMINAWKSAVKSREAEYKAVINAAISASNRQKKENK